MTDPEAATEIEDALASAGEETSVTADGPRVPVLDWRDRVDVETVGENSWRICDSRMPPDDARHVIAFAERTDEGIEVIWLAEGHTRARFSHIDDAARTAHLVLLRIAAERRRPIPIHHLPPVSGRRVRHRTRPAMSGPFEEDADEPGAGFPLPPS